MGRKDMGNGFFIASLNGLRFLKFTFLVALFIQHINLFPF